MTSSLAGLPVELMTAVAHDLDKKTLRSLCLVGNHVLLAIAQPLIWNEVILCVDLDDIGRPSPYMEYNLFSFTAKQKLARSVVSARITFSGTYDYNEPITRLLGESLKSLTNLSCARLYFSEASPADTDEGPSLLKVVLQSLVNLKSLHVEGYLADEEKPVVPMRLPRRLKNIATSYCSPSMAQTWTLVKNLEALELGGGDGPQRHSLINFGRRSARPYTGYEGDLSGVDYLLNKDLLQSGYFDHMRRLHIFSGVLDREECVDVDHVIEFFTLYPNSLEALEELLLRLPFTASEYAFMLGCVATPGLKRLMMNLEEISFNYHEMTNALSQTQWTELTSLEELWLPLWDMIETSQEVLSPISCLKNLRYLHFKDDMTDEDGYDMDMDYLTECVTSIGMVLPRLELVLWIVHYRIFRGQEGIIEAVVREKYEVPKWLLFSPTTM